MILSEEGRVAVRGRRVELQVELIQIMRALNEKGILDKKELIFLVNLACESEDKLVSLAREAVGATISDIVESIGEEKAGEFFREMIEKGGNNNGD